MKILNLYAGIGGNRKLWNNEHEITAIEYDPEIAAIYKHFFPNDDVITGDAHVFLLENFTEYDFIWASPPCPTHSRLVPLNFSLKERGKIDYEVKYPDMRLYQEIILLSKLFGGLFVIENVRPYYKPLINPTIELDRHYFWSNFPISKRAFEKNTTIEYSKISDYENIFGFDLSNFKVKNKKRILRNCVLPAVGEYILSEAEQFLDKNLINFGDKNER